MPWRGPQVRGEFPTLGYLVGEWVEENCVIPDGDQLGEPFILTDEMWTFLLWFYRLHATAQSRKWKGQRFWFDRGGQIVRPQKWGKGPFSAAITCAEAAGPTLPAGWDANGEPVGRPRQTAIIQITGSSQDQAGNVWGALVPMIELSDLAADIPDTGETRINFPGGGGARPVTSSGRSRLGQRVTFIVQDQTESYTQTNGGRDLADNQRRNLAGMGGRFLSTPNAWDPSEQSVAQTTATEPGVHNDYPEPPPGSVKNKRERRRVLRAVYGDSCKDGPGGRWKGWVDLERIDSECEALIGRDPAQAERWFMNRANAGSSAAWDMSRYDQLVDVEHVVPDGSLIVVGVDGARFVDALAIVATEVETFHQWPLAIIERPDKAGDDYEHDFTAADGAMAEAFEKWAVWRVYIDPQRIEALVNLWQGRWTDKVVLEWHTNRPRQIAHAVRRYGDTLVAGELSHDGDSVLRRHHANARRSMLRVKDDEGRPMHTLCKPDNDPQRKIDASMAAVLSLEAAGDAVAADAKPTKKKRNRATFL